MTRSRTHITFTLVATAAFLACTSDVTSVDRTVQPRTTSSAAKYTDWSTPVSLGAIVNSSANEQNAQLQKDGLAIYFSSNRPGGLGGLDIYVTRRASLDSPWEVPVNVGAPINSPSMDFAPNISIDGHLLFYSSDRPGGHGGPDIYVSHRANSNEDGWSAPVNVGPEVNSVDSEQAPNYHQNAEAGAGNLYFSRGVPALNQADLYYASVLRHGVGQGPVVLVTELTDVGFNEQAASLRHDAKEIFFFSNRPGGQGGVDIWTSTRQNAKDSWSPPTNVAPLNTLAFDGTPNLSFDGLTMLLGSSRPGGLGGNDIYMTTRARP